MTRDPVPMIDSPAWNPVSSAQNSGQPRGNEPPIDPQSGSLLFRMPAEVRRIIFAHVFASARRDWDMAPWPTPNPLGLALTCRRAYSEVGSDWHRNAVLDFPCKDAMLDRLGSLPQDMLQNIRHVHVMIPPFMVRGSWITGAPPYSPDTLTATLPELRLDTLTVRCVFIEKVKAEMLAQFIARGCGWRELRFVWRDYFESHSPPGPVVAHWRSLLEDRDGPSAGSSVELFKAPVTSFFDRRRRVWFGQDPGGGWSSLAGVEAFGRETMAVVRRGPGVDIGQTVDVEPGEGSGGAESPWGMAALPPADVLGWIQSGSQTLDS